MYVCIIFLVDYNLENKHKIWIMTYAYVDEIPVKSQTTNKYKVPSINTN
jgi:hypothetical protein